MRPHGAHQDPCDIEEGKAGDGDALTVPQMAAAAQAHLVEQFAGRGTVLMAAVVGSRMKGLHSAASDVDVRVVWVGDGSRTAQSWTRTRDGVLYEYMAWGLQRFVDLLKASNAEAVDSLMSPLQLAPTTAFVDRCRSVFSTTASLRKYAKGLLSNCTNNWKTYSRHEEVLNHRHYLYVLAPILGIMCIADSGELPDMCFNSRLCDAIGDPVLHELIMGLVYEKRDGRSRFMRLPVLDDFIVRALRRCREGVEDMPQHELSERENAQYNAIVADFE